MADGGAATVGDRLDDVETAVASKNVRRLRALLAGSDPVVLVPERNAIQVIGCGGQVAGHFKLPPEVLTALTE